MQAIAPGTIVFHRHRGYGVLTAVNLLTGWVAARFGNEARALDLNLACDDLQHADGEPILFRRAPPERMPHARLMAMVRALHAAGYQRLYLYTWPNASGLHWRWQLFAGPRHWMQRPLREGWYGSGADYNFNPVLGWGDAPGASSTELIHAFAQFDPVGLAQALGRDEDHTHWFANVCDALLPNYAYSLGTEHHHLSINAGGTRSLTADALPTMAVRQHLAPYNGIALPWPPGWQQLWHAPGAQYASHRVVRHDIIPSVIRVPLDY